MTNWNQDVQHPGKEELIGLLSEAKLETEEPNKHDGSYEIVQKAAALYRADFPKTVGLADLDLFYYLPLIMGRDAKQRRIDGCSLGLDQKAELTLLLNEIQRRQKDKYYENDSEGGREKFGMFKSALGTYNRENSVPLSDAERLVRLFADLSADLSEVDKIERVRETFKRPIKWFKNATASQILHCIDPYTFPIINGHQGRDNLYSLLIDDIPAAKARLNDLTCYADYCLSIKEFRDNECDFKFYRVFDRAEAKLAPTRSKKARLRAADSATPEQRAIAVLSLDENLRVMDEIHEEVSMPNLFDVLKIAGWEIRHSNVLAWLLKPSENHGMGDTILKSFLELVGNAAEDDGRHALEAIIRTGDTSDFHVHRERQHVDLIIESESNECAIAVENKTFSSESEGQLCRYCEAMEKGYGQRQWRFYVYLTPNGDPSSCPDVWRAMSYRELIGKIDTARKELAGEIGDDAAMILDHYSRTVRSTLLEEGELKKICVDAYKRYRLAFDTVFEYVKSYSESEVVKDLIFEWLHDNAEDFGVTWVDDREEGVFFVTDSLEGLLRRRGTEVDLGDFYSAENSYSLNVDESDVVVSAPSSIRRLDVASDVDARFHTVDFYDADEAVFEASMRVLLEKVRDYEESLFV